MKKDFSHLLSTLNSKVIFIEFEPVGADSRGNLAQGFYFGLHICIEFPFSQPPQDFDGNENFFTLSVKSYYSALSNFEGIFKVASLVNLIEAINRTVKGRPFDIVWDAPGRYILLDPDGADYIGETVTLKDAKKTCCLNFK